MFRGTVLLTCLYPGGFHVLSDSTASCYPCTPDIPADVYGDSRGQNRESTVACDCEKREMTAKELKQINPPVRVTSVFDLYFGSNNLKELTSDTFTGWKNVSLPKSIRTLNLQYNGITTIAPKSLDTLKNLQILDLSNNELETLPIELFELHIRILKRINLSHNKLHFIPEMLFRNLNVLTELRLSNNFLTSFSGQALKYTSSIHALYMDNNNLTYIEKGWFSAFHERWRDGDNEKHGAVFIQGNPWVCDCTMIDFFEWQKGHEWFRSQYGQKGYVDLGRCQYPSSVRNYKFYELTTNKMNCNAPKLLDHSPTVINSGTGEIEEFFVVVSGLPPPTVTFNITAENHPIIQTEKYQQPPIFSDEHQADNDGPAVKHAIVITDKFVGAMNIEVTIVGTSSSGEERIMTENFKVDVKTGRSGFMTVVFVLILLLLTGYIVYRYRDELKGLVSLALSKSGRGGHLSTDYTYVPTEADTSALVSNEVTYDPPEQTLRINV